jgi:hypothetical protein
MKSSAFDKIKSEKRLSIKKLLGTLTKASEEISDSRFEIFISEESTNSNSNFQSYENGKNFSLISSLTIFLIETRNMEENNFSK